MGDTEGGDHVASDFLVEWYQPETAATSTHDAAARLARATTAAEGGDRSPVALTILVAVPADQTLFAVFRADHEDDVIRICSEAGWPPDRISTDVSSWVRNPMGCAVQQR